MKPIRILPHHIQGLFDIMYLGIKPEQTFKWYSPDQKSHVVKMFKKIVSNPGQLVQIVDSYDDVNCRFCIENKNSVVFSKKSNPCNRYDTPNAVVDWQYTKVLGLEKSVRSIVTSAQLKELMHPTYEKFLLAILKEPALSTKYNQLLLFTLFNVIYDMCKHK